MQQVYTKIALTAFVVMFSQIETVSAGALMCEPLFKNTFRSIELSMLTESTPELRDELNKVDSVISEMTTKANLVGLLAPSKVKTTLADEIPHQDLDNAMGFSSILLSVRSEPELLKLTHVVAAHEFGHLVFTANLVKKYPKLRYFFEAQELIRSPEFVRLKRLEAKRQAGISVLIIYHEKLEQAREKNDFMALVKLKDAYDKVKKENLKMLLEIQKIETQLHVVKLMKQRAPKKEQILTEISAAYSELFTEVQFGSYGGLTAGLVKSLGYTTSERGFAELRDTPLNLVYQATNPGQRDVHEMTGPTRSYLWNVVRHQPTVSKNNMVAVKMLFEAIILELEFFSEQTDINFKNASTAYINARLIERLKTLSSP